MRTLRIKFSRPCKNEQLLQFFKHNFMNSKLKQQQKKPIRIKKKVASRFDEKVPKTNEFKTIVHENMFLILLEFRS